jgi:hypothetical protein
MEQSVNDDSVDKVLIICDKAYTDKANNREGGVGDETVIISPEIYGYAEQEKFIPVIFEVDPDGKPYCPTYMKSRMYIDLSTEDALYEMNYETLLRDIHNKPLHRKPALGTVPQWLENENVDLFAIRDSIKKIRGYTGDNKNKIDFLIRKCANEFVNALLSFVPPEGKPLDESLMSQIDEVKILRDLFLEYLEEIIYADLTVGEIIPDLIVKIYNSTHGCNSFSKQDFEFYDFFLWELFICTTTVLLHYEKFKELNSILTHTYYLRENNFNDNVQAFNFTIFRCYFHIIEEKCKPKCDNPHYCSLSSEILLKREKKPIITKSSLANADMVLYQLSYTLDLISDDRTGKIWFPLTLYEKNGKQPIWSQLTSKKYCQKIMPLFGVDAIDDIKKVIKKTPSSEKANYDHWKEAYFITDSVNAEKIGTLN